MAMALAGGLAASGKTTVRGAEAIKISFPAFLSILRSLTRCWRGRWQYPSPAFGLIFDNGKFNYKRIGLFCIEYNRNQVKKVSGRCEINNLITRKRFCRLSLICLLCLQLAPTGCLDKTIFAAIELESAPTVLKLLPFASKIPMPNARRRWPGAAEWPG